MTRTFSGPIHRKSRPPTRDADGIAIEMLAFLADDDERLARFLSTTGLDVGSLRATASAAGFAEGMLAYVSADEPLLIAFAETRGYDPAEIEMLRLSLSPPAPDF